MAENPRVGSGELGYRSGLKTFSDLAQESSFEKRVAVRLKPKKLTGEWFVHSGATYVTQMEHSWDGRPLDVVGVTSLIEAPLVRAETLAACIATAGTYYYDPSAASGVRRWDDGLSWWDVNLLDTGIVGHWKGEDETDASGNGNDLDSDIGTGATYTTGLDGDAHTLDGANASKRTQASGISVIDAFGASDDFAYALKFKRNSKTNAVVFQMGQGITSNPGYAFVFENSGTELHLKLGDGTVVLDSDWGDFSTGVWHSLAVVTSRSKSMLWGYANQVLKIRFAIPSAMGGLASSQNLGIGCNPDTDTLILDGQVDQVVVWDGNADFYESEEHSVSLAEKYHNGAFGGTPGAVTIPEADPDPPVWDEFRGLYVHLTYGSDPNKTRVVAELGVCIAGKGETHPEIGPDKTTNGTFESWASSTDLNNWSETLAGTGWSIDREATVVKNGTYSLSINSTGSATGSAFAVQSITTVDGNLYRVSGYYRTPAGQDPIFQPYVLMSSGAEYLQNDARSYDAGVAIFQLAKTEGEWRRFVIDFRAKGTTHVLRLAMQDAIDGTVAGSVYYDDVKFQWIPRFNYHEPRVSNSALPVSSTGSRDVFFGGKQIGVGNLTLTNADGRLDVLMGSFDWMNAEVEVQFGGKFLDDADGDGQALMLDDYRSSFTGLVQGIRGSDKSIILNLHDSRAFFHRKLPPDSYDDLGDFAELDQSFLGTPRALWFGAKENITPVGISKDATTGYRTYELADCTDAPNGIKAVDAVYAYLDVTAAGEKRTDKRVTLTVTTDYTVDLTNGQITVVGDASVIEITDENNQLDFDEGSTELTAVLTKGVYTPRLLAAEIKAQMDAVGGDVYTVSYSDTTHLITIASDGTELNLLVNTGTHKEVGPWALLGFDTGDDKADAVVPVSIVADNAIFENADRDHVIRVDGDGFKDDASGTFTGSANALIEIGADICRVLLVKYLGKPASVIDETSFATARTRAPESLALFLNKSTDTKTLFEALESSNIANITIDGGGQVFYEVYVGDVPDSIVDLFDRDFVKFSTEQKIAELFATVRVLHDEDPSTGAFEGRSANDDEVQARFGRPDLKTITTFIKIGDNAQAAANRVLELAKTPARRISGVVKGKLVDARVGQKIRLTRRRAMDANGRLSNAVARILTLKQSHQLARTEFTAVDDMVTVAGVACVSACQSVCESSCQETCETTCQSTCETSCQESCEVSCQDCTQTSCQEACETACQAACEAGCQVGCQIACQSGCQVSCQGGCQIGCESACELSCQTACQSACQTACETGCQSGCETSCQEMCETSCQTGCETGCQETCEVNCQTSCEMFCQSTCQSTCQTVSEAIREIP